MKTETYIYNNPIHLLSFLSKQARQSPDYIASKIAAKMGFSISSVYEILKRFEDMDVIRGTRVGRAIIYEVDKDNPIVRSFRVFDNLVELNALVKKLKPHCRKILLFGSCARGEDTTESDIDLFIVADEDERETVRRLISEYQIDREIKPVIVDTVELMEMQDKDNVFYSEVIKGIELWGAESLISSVTKALKEVEKVL